MNKLVQNFRGEYGYIFRYDSVVYSDCDKSYEKQCIYKYKIAAEQQQTAFWHNVNMNYLARMKSLFVVTW